MKIIRADGRYIIREYSRHTPWGWAAAAGETNRPVVIETAKGQFLSDGLPFDPLGLDI